MDWWWYVIVVAVIVIAVALLVWSRRPGVPGSGMTPRTDDRIGDMDAEDPADTDRRELRDRKASGRDQPPPPPAG